MAGPFLPYIFLMLFFNMSIASSKGITWAQRPSSDQLLKAPTKLTND
jgi:hypothetical protein